MKYVLLGSLLLVLVACSPAPVTDGFVECLERPEACTLEFDPVCGTVNTGDVVLRTFSNGCSACAEEGVLGYVPGACENANPDLKYAICDTIDPVLADNFDLSMYECVDVCPEGYDNYGTQIGIRRCIEHMGLEDLEKRSKCIKSTDNCECIKVDRTTDGERVNLGYRCIEDESFKDMLVQSGLCKLDRVGVQHCVIA